MNQDDDTHPKTEGNSISSVPIRDPLTIDAQRTYLACGGNKCPWCESPEIEGTGQSNSDSDWHENEVGCKTCGGIWLDIYTISGVQGVSGPVQRVSPQIVVETARADRATGACDGKRWEAWKENGRWRVAGHGWYPTGEIAPIIAAIRMELQNKKRA